VVEDQGSARPAAQRREADGPAPIDLDELVVVDDGVLRELPPQGRHPLDVVGELELGDPQLLTTAAVLLGLVEPGEVHEPRA
jgi:hypothetical protein